VRDAQGYQWELSREHRLHPIEDGTTHRDCAQEEGQAVKQTKFDKAMDENREILYSVLVEYQKEENNETKVQDRNSNGQPSL